jgi:hypothetical protein
VALGGASLLRARRAARDRLAPAHLGRLHVVRDDVLDGPRLPRLRDGQRAGMGGQEGRGNARKHQTGEHRHGQHVLLDLLPPRGLGGAKHDALHAVVDAPARLEGNRVRGTGEVVQVRLEEPEGLRMHVSTHVGPSETRGRAAHQQRAVHRLLAEVDYKLLQRHGLVVDADEQVA